ncbi:carbonate dehydratase [Variovorax paradoxus]|nr:carbonate dehydratase [Variovorax paradoxus]MBT2302424.1 carbonate dehydratase [Variovorax paradoxus]
MSNPSVAELFARNREWAAAMERDRPGFFRSLMAQQRPAFMWIGCSDSRVPANQITGLEPGEIFVHRNIANVVIPTDLNCISTIQFAVDQLKVRDLMVVGHHGCGGVLAALEDRRVGLADNWLQHVKNVRDRHANLLDGVAPEFRHDALCELNVIEQVINVAHTTVIRDAWSREQKVTLHGWVYALSDGLLRDLRISIDGIDQIEPAMRHAVEQVTSRERA